MIQKYVEERERFHSVVKTILELTVLPKLAYNAGGNPPVSVTQELGLSVWATTLTTNIF